MNESRKGKSTIFLLFIVLVESDGSPLWRKKFGLFSFRDSFGNQTQTDGKKLLLEDNQNLIDIQGIDFNIKNAELNFPSRASKKICFLNSRLDDTFHLSTAPPCPHVVLSVSSDRMDTPPPTLIRLCLHWYNIRSRHPTLCPTVRKNLKVIARAKHYTHCFKQWHGKFHSRRFQG